MPQARRNPEPDTRPPELLRASEREEAAGQLDSIADLAERGGLAARPTLIAYLRGVADGLRQRSRKN